jgi:aspartate aminotransferase
MQESVNNGSMIREMFEAGKRLAAIYGSENVFDYSIGNPNVLAPESVKESIKNILDNEDSHMVHGYMNNAGYEDVRSKIAEYENRTKGTSITTENILMTCGAAGGLNTVFKSLLNPGDEVITFAPYFVEYRNYTNNFNAKLVVVPADTTTFQPNLELLADRINKNTKIVMINSPNNPSGVIYNEETIKKMAELLTEKEKELGIDITLLSDEPYREIVYNDAKVPYILNYYHNAIVGYSFSKSLSLPGERIGYLVVSSEIKDFEDVMAALKIANRILGFVNAPSLFQRVVAENLDAKVDVDYYRQNRDALYNHLIKLGYECIYPEGAFYLFVKSPIKDDVKFCEDAKQFNLLLVPGSVFGCASYVRLSYCISHETIERSFGAFEKLMSLYK